MKTYREYKTTINRTVYNRRRKELHAHCSFCKWHNTFYKYSENGTTKNYAPGGREPSWKLVSKQKKQWMKKPIYIHTWKRNGYSEYRW